MVESAMEFLRIARDENYHEIVLSMKSSNPLVMVQAYRLLVQKMDEEFHECYPLHLGVTEAGDGEDGRIKSAIGIGTLLEDGIGDTIRVSLTEDPEFEIPVCRDIVKRYQNRMESAGISPLSQHEKLVLPYSPFSYKRRQTTAFHNIGSAHAPVVIADLSHTGSITPQDLEAIGYRYHTDTDKWSIGDAAADYIYTESIIPGFALPGTLQVICNYKTWKNAGHRSECHPLLHMDEYLENTETLSQPYFVYIGACISLEILQPLLDKIKTDANIVLCVADTNAMASVRRLFIELEAQHIHCPVIVFVKSDDDTVDEQLIHFATEAGALLLDGFGDGIWLQNKTDKLQNTCISGRTYLKVKNNSQFLNNTAFSILQATRTRISKTEYISCPSCGRTLFDLQETTAKIRAATHHLKGVKIAIMGCIVNGPGEMADADFGYVGSGPGKITLYKGKEIIKKNVPSEIAVDELIQLLKDHDAWVEAPMVSA